MEAVTQVGALPDEEAKAPAGFEIEGKRYEIPKLSTINLDEERILYVYADVVLQDFAPVDPRLDDAAKQLIEFAQFRHIRNPDFKRALAHIAYRRKHPDVSDADIQSAMGLVNALEVDMDMIRAEDEEDPTRGSPKTRSSVSGENGSSEPTSTPSESTTTGSDTENALGIRELTRIPTGTHESDTSSESSRAIPA